MTGYDAFLSASGLAMRRRDLIKGIAGSVAAWPLAARAQVNEIEPAIAAFARYPNGSLIITAGPVQVFHRDLIIKLAAQHKLPAIYIERFFAEAGGLMSYGPNLVEANRRAASYVARILKGEKPADLPVQAPTKYDLVINLKAAKTINLTVPPSLLASADAVIE